MPYQGVAFALILGVGLATAALMYLFSTQERPEQRYTYAPFKEDDNYPNGWQSRTADDSTNRRRRRSTNSTNGSSVSCTICTSELSPPTAVKKLNCGHLFHRLCIEQWARIRRTCPICRLQF